MTALLKKITLSVALGASGLAGAAPAEAQRYGSHRGRDNGDAAIIAGVAGLAIGAAIASSANRRDRGYYYDRGYEGPIVAYPQVYDDYYEGGYRGYDYRGHDRYRGYNSHYARSGGYDRSRGYGDRRGSRR